MSIIEKKEKYLEIEDKDIFLKPFLSFPKRKIGEVKESIEKRIQELVENFSKFETKVNAVFEKIEKNENKGSFLVQLDNFKKEISEINAVGNFEEIFVQIEKYEIEINEIIASNRKRNLDIKLALLEEAHIFSNSTNWKQASEEMNDLKMRWQKTGAVVAERKEELENKLQGYFDEFYQKRAAFFENTGENVEEYQNLIALAKEKLSLDISKNVAEEMKDLQLQWKNLTQIPGKQYAELSKEFRSIQNTFFNQLKEHIDGEKIKNIKHKQVKSLEIKKQLIEQAKKLFENIENDHFETIKELRKKWKSAGATSSKVSEEIWDEFNYQIGKLIELQKLLKIEKNILKENKDATDETIKMEKERYLKKSIRFEKEDLEKMTTNVGNFRINHKSNGFSNVMDSKTKEQERRLKIKEDLLKNLK